MESRHLYRGYPLPRAVHVTIDKAISTSTRALLQRAVHAFAPASTLLAASPLHGGVSAETVRLELADFDVPTVVMRRHGERDLAFNPDVARVEFEALELLEPASVPAPRPIALVEGVYPHPAIIISFLPGAPDPDLAFADNQIPQLAGTLAEIHAVNAGKTRTLPRLETWVHDRLAEPPAVPDESMQETLLRQAISARWPYAPGPSCLLHGDYWPGNYLFESARLTGIIDWEDACIGNPAYDLARARMELLWACGDAVAARFTDAYKQITNRPLNAVELARWDLIAALMPVGFLSSWNEDKSEVERMRAQHRDFVRNALAVLEDAGA